MQLDSTAILTPSRITTSRRYRFAAASLRSLRTAIGGDVALYVVHDSPTQPRFMPYYLYRLTRAYRWDQKTEGIYSGAHDHLIRRCERGSASAMRGAVAKAQAEGKKYGFIHLDDHVYHENFDRLFWIRIIQMQ